MQANILADLFLANADPGYLVGARVLARLLRLQAQILKVVGAGRVHELHKLAGRASIGIAQHALHVIVVVLDGPADEPFLVQAGGQARLLGAGVDEGVVQAADDLVGHAFEGPRTHANVLGAQLQLDHVVHAGGALGHRTGIVRVRVVLQLAQRLLGGRQWVDHEAGGREEGSFVVILLSTGRHEGERDGVYYRWIYVE